MQITQRLTTTVAILSVTALGLIGGVAVPAALSTRGLVDDIRVKQHEIDARFEAQRRIRNSMADFETVVERVAALASVAVREDQELLFVTAIEEAAEASRVEHTLSLETANQKDLSPWERQVPVRISADGAYPDIVRFLNAIERLPYLVIVDSINVTATSAAADRTGPSEVSAAVAGTVYWQRSTVPDYVKGKTSANGAN